MVELLATYSLAEILTILIAAALSIKGLISFYDWAFNRIKAHFHKEITEDLEQKDLEERLNDEITERKLLSSQLKQTLEVIENLNQKIDLLIDSDKDSIKAYITKEHHYFTNPKIGWIDDYSLDCIERRYGHYQEEGGNSFIGDLMHDLRRLPKKDPASKIENRDR